MHALYVDNHTFIHKNEDTKACHILFINDGLCIALSFIQGNIRYTVSHIITVGSGIKNTTHLLCYSWDAVAGYWLLTMARIEIAALINYFPSCALHFLNAGAEDRQTIFINKASLLTENTVATFGLGSIGFYFLEDQERFQIGWTETW